MVSVASLLNHDLEEEQLPTPVASSTYSSECSPAPSERVSKKPRLTTRVPKDVAVFRPGKISGEVRYPPHETSSSRVLNELALMKVNPFPLAKILEYPRHIPYNSEKKQLYRKTGRDGFEVFQYTFEPPGHAASYTVIWDYNIGLVRMTPFFKCRRYAKTVPSRMMDHNPGLRDICHSITGGALVAQGYWIPYAAAKALAATFCWDFRYALVPIFGTDFPDLCIRPEAEGYGIMVIDQKIIQQCTRDVEAFRSMQQKTTVNKISNSAKDTATGQPDQSDQKYHNVFRPVNRPMSMSPEISKDKHHEFLRTPARTPERNWLSPPVKRYQSPLNPPNGLSRLQIPRTEGFNQSRQTKASSPFSNSSDSSDSEVSPKTTRRKRGFYASNQAQEEAAHSAQTLTEPAPNNGRVNQADMHAAQILVDLRTAVQHVRKG